MYLIKFKKTINSDYEIYKNQYSTLEEVQSDKTFIELNGFWFNDDGTIISPPNDVVIEEY